MVLPLTLIGALCTSYSTPPTVSFATFGNDQTRALIKAWKPNPLPVKKDETGILPASEENMKRYVRARILLEEPNTGCIACSTSENQLCVILCRFSRTEHRLLLPLWQGEIARPKTFEQLLSWHKERFSQPGASAPSISGSLLEYAADRQAWAEGLDKFSP